MAVIKLPILIGSVEKAAEVYSRFSHIRVFRSITTVGGTYTQIATVKLDQGKTAYNYYDESGETTYWYKVDFWNAATLASSNDSDPRLGDDAIALQHIMTVDELKAIYLTGVDLTDDAGNPYPDIMFDFSIRAAIAWIERALDIDTKPTARTDFYDYNQEEWQNAWAFIQLDHYPCQPFDYTAKGHYIKMNWPSSGDPYEIPEEWIRFEADAGHINLVPTSGTLGAALMLGGSMLPSVLSRYPFIPRAIEVKYESGFAVGALPADIRALIGMKAAQPIFNVAGDLIAGAGIANFSLSVDGLSQSIGTTSSATNSGYGARIIQYSNAIKADLPTIRHYYKNVGLAMG